MLKLLAIAAYLGGILWLLFGVERSDPVGLILAVLITVPGYLIASRSLTPKLIFQLGCGLRIAALFAFPLLSDDIYRFLWDGALWWNGIHPLSGTPEALAVSLEGAAFAKTHATLLEQMNSAGYFTVYPPLSQLVFSLAGGLANHIYLAAVILKLPLFAAELGIAHLLRCRLPVGRKFAWYWLHPLVIVELLGNVHFEGVAMLGILAAIAALSTSSIYTRQKWRSVLASSAYLAVGVLVKLVPTIFAPALALKLLWPQHARWVWKHGLAFSFAFLLLICLGFVPFSIGVDAAGFGESLDLYFRSFEFNASLYTIARALGIWYKGWNWIAVIGPSLSLLATVSILALAGYRAWKQLDLAETLLWSATIYLLCATTVHPWYFIYLLALAPLTRYKWPYLLGFTAFLSYIAYAKTPIEVPPWALALEYLPVMLLAIWECRRYFRLPIANQT